MATWVELSVRDLEAARHAELVDAVRRQAKSLGQPDPVPVAIAKIVAEVRGVIEFSGLYAADAAATTMAPNLVDLCVQKIARVLMPRINRALTEDEVREEKTYEARLVALRDGKWPVDASDTPAAAPSVQTVRPRPRICRPVRRFTRTTGDGL